MKCRRPLSNMHFFSRHFSFLGLFSCIGHFSFGKRLQGRYSEKKVAQPKKENQRYSY
jgi:hypothetical protein